jgi:dTMP kinase
MYIALCGIDGSGKSTALRAVTDWLNQNQPRTIVNTEEPGGTPTAEAIRKVLLHSGLPLTDKERMLLMSSARYSTLNEVINPALEREDHVVASRCYLSTEVYQANTPELLSLFKCLHVGITVPDIIILLDAPSDKTFARLNGELDDIEIKGVEFQEECRKRYLNIAETNPFIVKASSSGTMAETYQNVIEALTRAFSNLNPLAIQITNDVLTYNGKDGHVKLHLDVVHEQLIGYGYTFDKCSEGTWETKLGYNSIGSNLLHENQVIKLAFVDAINRGYWNGITYGTIRSGEGAT